MNWRRGGHRLRAHRVPVCSPDSGVVTSVALDDDWVIVGLANCRIHIFSAKTGVLTRTLIGHELGVWAVHLISKGGSWDAQGNKTKGSRLDRSGKSRGLSGDDGDDIKTLAHDLAGVSLRGDHVTSSSSIGHDLDHPLSPLLRTAIGLDGSTQSSSPLRLSGDDELASDFIEPVSVGMPSDPCCRSEGWGQPNALVVSGGCDKVLRVWDVKSG